MNNKLTLTDETGAPISIDVLDILSENEFNKEFVLYTIEGDSDSIFASILNETENSFSLDTIENDKEIDYVTKEIDRVMNDYSME